MSLCNYTLHVALPGVPAPSFALPSIFAVSISLNLIDIGKGLVTHLAAPLPPTPSYSLPSIPALSFSLSFGVYFPGAPSLSFSLLPSIPIPSFSLPLTFSIGIPAPFCPLD